MSVFLEYRGNESGLRLRCIFEIILHLATPRLVVLCRKQHGDRLTGEGQRPEARVFGVRLFLRKRDKTADPRLLADRWRFGPFLLQKLRSAAPRHFHPELANLLRRDPGAEASVDPAHFLEQLLAIAGPKFLIDAFLDLLDRLALHCETSELMQLQSVALAGRKLSLDQAETPGL